MRTSGLGIKGENILSFNDYYGSNTLYLFSLTTYAALSLMRK